jgi:hypothetical protein
MSQLNQPIPITGSWPATIFLWAVVVFMALCGVWLWTIGLALLSLGVLPPLNRDEEQNGETTR